jgi:hypothetical protein
VPRKQQALINSGSRGSVGSEVTVVRIEALLFVALAACSSSRLELGRDLPTASGPSVAPAARTTTSCDGTRCFGGPEQQLSASLGPAKSLVLDEQNAYWADPDAQLLMITPRDGATTMAVEAPPGGPYRLVADADYVYYSGGTGGYIGVLAKAGHGTKLLVGGEESAQGLAVAYDSIFFFGGGDGGSLKRAWFDVTMADDVATGLPVMTIATGISAGGQLAVDRDWVYYSDAERGELSAVRRAGGEVVLLAEGRTHPGALLPRGEWLYFLELGSADGEHADGQLLRMPKAGGSTEVLVEQLDAPLGLAADDTSVYVSTRGRAQNGFRGRIVRRADSGQVSTLVTGQAEPTSIAVDARAVFWTADSGLYALPR